MANLSEAELRSGLMQFTGTEGYTRASALMRKLVMTDGVKWLAENAGCFWMLDAIASHLITNEKVRREEFQVWRFKRNGPGDSDKHRLTMSDGNDNIIVTQEIEYSDFPLPEIELWLELGEAGDEEVLVLLLPSEH